MSSFTKFGLLSLVSSAVAVPFHYRPSGYAAGTGAPYALNTTGLYAPTGSGSPIYPGTSTTTQTLDLTETVVSTVYLSAVPVTSEAATVGAEAVSTEGVCGPQTITVTATNAVTVTVTPGGGYEAVSSSVVAAEAIPSSSSQAAYHSHGHNHVHSSRSSFAAYTPPAYTAPAYTPPASSAEEVSTAAVVPSVYVPVSSAAVVSSPAVVSKPVAVSSVAAVSSAAVYSSAVVSSAATPSATSSPSTGGTKRGLAYNDASLTTCFEGDNTISWAYNWAQTSSGLNSKFEYVPMLIDLRDQFTSTWETNWKAALKSGSTNFMSFNEPELPAQANLTPKVAAAKHIVYMNPVKAAGGRVASPSVTNGDATQGYGLGYLKAWDIECAGQCDYDVVNIHWYDSATNIQYFKDHVTEAHTQSGKPVWLTEFAATGSDDQVATFLKTVLPWLDEQPFVEKYSYYMVADGKLVSGTTPSTIGSVYASA